MHNFVKASQSILYVYHAQVCTIYLQQFVADSNLHHVLRCCQLNAYYSESPELFWITFQGSEQQKRQL